MDRFHGKPNSQFLSSSGKKEESQYGRQMNRTVSQGSPTWFFLVSFLLTCSRIFLLGSLFKNTYINKYILA